MPDRTRYVVSRGPSSPEPHVVCAALFDVLDRAVVVAQIDAYSDYAEQMPADIRAAQDWLRRRGLGHDGRDPGSGIRVGHDDETGWAIVRAYAPWSIRTILLDAAGSVIATLDDGGQSVTVSLTDGQTRTLIAAVGPQVALSRLVEFPSHRDRDGDGGSPRS